MKKISLFLVLAMLAVVLAGCAGTPVIYQVNCNCPTAAPAATEAPAVETPAAEGAVKTGLYIGAAAGESKNASAEANGEAKYDVTVVAVALDENTVASDVSPFEISVEGLAKEVLLLPAGTPVPFENKDGRTVFTTRPLHIFDTYCIK